MQTETRDGGRGGSALAELIEKERRAILERWCDKARLRLSPVAELSGPVLVDHLPELLDEIVVSLRRFASGARASETKGLSECASSHGKQRWQAGVTLNAVVREYELLRDTVFESIDEAGADITLDEIGVFSHAITKAITEAVDRFTEKRDAELRDVELRFKRLFESGIVGQCEWEASGAITAANDTFLRMIGYTREDLDDGKLNFVKLTPPQHQAATRTAVRTLQEQGVVQPFERQYLRKDGSLVDILLSSVTLDAAGTRGIALALDISERRRLEKEREERSQMEQEFLAIVSHDLRNPLSAILMAADAQLRRGSHDASALRALARIKASAERAARLIDDLLDLTRARLGGGIPVSRVSADFHAIVRRVVDEVHGAHPDRCIDTVAEGEGAALLDPDRVSQVVANIVSNAVQHSPADTPVRVSSRGDERELTLEVFNKGAPVPDELRPHLFHPFRSGKNGGAKSLGLGLYIACKIVESHHGRIDVSSDAESGTMFKVALPRG